MTSLSRHAFETGRPRTGMGHWTSLWLGSRSTASHPPRAWSVALANEEVQVLTDFLGGSIGCIAGCVWLTYDGDCRDVLLEPGQLHVSDRSSRLVIFAMEPSAVRLVPPLRSPC
jgi:hypothetical protein